MLGKLVRELRGLNMSQRELAQKIGVSHSYISKLESNSIYNITDEVIDKLASALECDRTIMYTACGKIPPDQLSINPDAPSVYKEIEQYIRSNSTDLTTSPDEIGVLSHAFNRSKTIILLVNYKNQELIYMNTSAKLFLKRTFPHHKVEHAAQSIITEIISTHNSTGSESTVNTYKLNDVDFLVDLCLESFMYHHQQYLLIQIFEERSVDRLNAFALLNEKYFNAVFNHSLNAIFVFNYTHQDYGALIHVNPSACNLLGYDKDELLTLVGPKEFEIQTANTAIRLQKLVHKKHFHDISIFKTKDNQIIPVEVFSHMGTMGEKTFIMLSCTNLNLFSSVNIKF